MRISFDALAPLLQSVKKPARYVGGEWNSIVKGWVPDDVTIALVYPDTYEIGMSNLGLMILYDIANQHPHLVAERAYTPWPDMEEALRKAEIPLYSLETRHALRDFDVIGFSLQHELTYSNVLTVLDLAGIPLRACARGDSFPLIIAGGSCVYNPEPMADFVDAFVIGEGEDVLIEILEVVRRYKATRLSRDALLVELSQIEGVYVPSLYRVCYTERMPAPVALASSGAPLPIRRRLMSRLGPIPRSPVVPSMRVVHDRAMVEIQRGCSHGCRFCQAGVIYRPLRQRPMGELLAGVDALLANTGYDEIGLVSLSSSEYEDIETLVRHLLNHYRDERVSVSLPSLRIDSFSVHLASLIQQTRKTGLTFAPEAGSQRLRDVINKGVTEDDLVKAATAAFENGWQRLKLYFMIGLPTETDEDVLEIARLVHTLQALGKSICGHRIELSVSVSTFVPKAHTPFQWVPLASRETVEHRQALLRQHLRGRGIRLSWSNWDSTWLEAVFSRGDRRLGQVILHAWRGGARFDAWDETFRPSLWRAALKECSVPWETYVQGSASKETALPWDHIDVGVSRHFLWREYERALAGHATPGCLDACSDCGIRQSYALEHSGPAEGWCCP